MNEEGPLGSSSDAEEQAFNGRAGIFIRAPIRVSPWSLEMEGESLEVGAVGFSTESCDSEEVVPSFEAKSAGVNDNTGKEQAFINGCFLKVVGVEGEADGVLRGVLLPCLLAEDLR